jgi:hypothetical protein
VGTVSVIFRLRIPDSVDDVSTTISFILAAFILPLELVGCNVTCSTDGD